MAHVVVDTWKTLVQMSACIHTLTCFTVHPAETKRDRSPWTKQAETPLQDEGVHEAIVQELRSARVTEGEGQSRRASENGGTQVTLGWLVCTACWDVCVCVDIDCLAT